MERKIKDEEFIANALAVATHEDGRHVANQVEFDGVDTDPLSVTAHAALITTVNIYLGRNLLSEAHMERAITAASVGAAKRLIDEIKPIIDGA